MHRCRHGLAVASVAMVASAALLNACGGSKNPAGGGADRVVDLHLAAGADASHLRETAKAIADRLNRLGVAHASASVAGRVVRVAAPQPIDPFALEAAARTDPVVVRPVNAADPPPCRGGASAVAPDPARAVRLDAQALGGFCLTLGPGVALGSAVSRAEAVARPSLGWTVSVALAAPLNAHISPALSALVGSGREVALVAGTDVITRFVWSSGVPSLQSQIEGNLSEWEARRVAAALVVPGALRSRIVAPRPPVPSGPRAEVDEWSAALGVDVCGRWLPNAPSFSGLSAASAGLHSHGDGLVSIHPYANDEAGTHATLGHFFQSGGWQLDPKRIAAWDGVVHRDGDSCPGGHAATLRYTVAGVERHGDPAALHLENRMVIVLAFVPPGATIGAPPQARFLRQPRWLPATS